MNKIGIINAVGILQAGKPVQGIVLINHGHATRIGSAQAITGGIIFVPRFAGIRTELPDQITEAVILIAGLGSIGIDNTCGTTRPIMGKSGFCLQGINNPDHTIECIVLIFSDALLW